MKSNFSTSISLSANGEHSRTIRLFVFLTLFCLLPLKLNAGEDLSFLDSDVTISMDFQDASLKDILKILSIQSGMNFIASEALQDRKITLFLDKVPVQETMDNLFKANNLSYELDSESNIFIVKDWGKPEIQTITKVYYLKYHPVFNSRIKKELGKDGKEGGLGGGLEGNIVASLEKILSPSGKITEDANTNSLIITDIPSRFPMIELVIAKLDIPVSQVLIEVEILDVSKDTVDKMGFEFGDKPFTLLYPNAYKHGLKFIGNVIYRGADAISTTSSTAVPAGAVVFGNVYGQALDFLRTQTDTKYLARPRLLTLNNETAEITITKDEVMEATPVLSTSTTGAVSITGYTFKRATELDLTKEGIGVSLRVTPQINLESGEITMFIYPKSSTSTANTYITVGQVKDPEIRSTKSIVKVKDGETIVLGGLIHHEKTVTLKKLPILGDIPFLGALFRHKNVSKDLERELIVFITPHIVKDTGLGVVSAKKAKLPIREQGTGSALDRQIAINTTLNSFKKIK